MGRTAQNGHGPSTARLLGLLALLLGLLALHGLASTHHASAAVPVLAAAHPGAADSAHAPAEPPGARGAGSAHLVRTSGVVHAFEAVRAVQAAGPDLPSPACEGGCRPDIAVLCLAVLVVGGGTALLTAVARRRAGRPLHSRPSTAGASAPRRTPPPAPDPVEDLCVSRT